MPEDRTGTSVPLTDILQPVLEGCNLRDKLESAIAWCDQEGVSSLAMLAEVDMVDEFVSSLGLKRAQEKLLCKRIQEATKT